MNDELYHYGVLGMKWGIRRYQNKDGSLTRAGRKRMSVADLARGRFFKKKRKRQTIQNEPQKPRPKTLSEMTDAEVKAKADRIRNERYIIENTPKKVSLGKKLAQDFGKMLMNEVIGPTTKSVGKTYLEKQLKEIAGLNVKTKKQKLDDEVAFLKATKDKQDLEDYTNSESRERRRQKEKDDAFMNRMKDASFNATYAKNINEIRKYFDEEKASWNKTYTAYKADASDKIADGKEFVEELFKNLET